jgi:hypothetical protein
MPPEPLNTWDYHWHQDCLHPQPVFPTCPLLRYSCRAISGLERTPCHSCLVVKLVLSNIRQYLLFGILTVELVFPLVSQKEPILALLLHHQRIVNIINIFVVTMFGGLRLLLLFSSIGMLS